MKKAQNVILVDFKAPDNWEFKRALEKQTGERWSVVGLESNMNHGSAIQNMIRYLKYFLLPLSIFFRHKRYGRIIAWQQFFGLILAFYLKLFHQEKSITLVVMTFIYKAKPGFIGRIYDWLVRSAVKGIYIDKFVVFSSSEPAYYANYFGVSTNKFQVIHLGIEDERDSFDCRIETPIYLLAAGRSNRDYDFLLSTFKSTEYSVKIVCDEYAGRPYPNIVYDSDCHGRDYLNLLAKSFCVLVPLNDSQISSGQLVFLQAMMFGKPVITTDTSTVKEYIVHGENGLIIEKDPDAWRNAVGKLVNDHVLYGRISQAGRERFKSGYTLFQMGTDMGNLLNEMMTDDH